MTCAAACFARSGWRLLFAVTIAGTAIAAAFRFFARRLVAVVRGDDAGHCLLALPVDRVCPK